MKARKIITLVAGIMAAWALFAFIKGHGSSVVKPPIAVSQAGGFAVLELFTSEGCSSCPPADALLAKLKEETARQPVYLLAYHVDYWDRLGWKDLFSDPEFSDRQKAYGQWLDVSPIYTPQLVINGKAQFIGSDELPIRRAMAEQLTLHPRATLSLQFHPGGKVLTIPYQATGQVKGSRLLIAIVEKAAQSKISRGENAGRTLSHVQIVREMQLFSLSSGGQGTSVLTLRENFNKENEEVIGFLQDQHSGEIIAAARAFNQ